MHLIKAPRITLTQLRTFAAVAQLGGITRAAQALHLAQPTVSTQLRELSDGLGYALLVPAGRGIKLTDAGLLLQKTAATMFKTWSAFEDDVAALQGMRRGVLRIAGVSTTEYFLARFIQAFTQKYPGIEIDLAVENRAAVVARLSNEQDDLAVMMMPPANLALNHFPFMDNPLVLVGPTSHPWAGAKRMPLSQLNTQPLLMREQGSGTRLATEQFLQSKGSNFINAIRPSMTLGSNEAVKHAIAAHLGIAVLSRHALRAKPADEGLAILNVAGFPIRRTWQLVWRSDRTLPLAASTFVAFLKQQVARERAS